MRVLSALILTLILSFPAAAAELKGVAVYPFAAKGGADGAMAEGLTALFQQELAGAACVRLVAEDVVRDLAKQQGLEQSCGTEECQIDLAQQAKAEFLVRGELAKIGSSYGITGYVIDLKTKKTAASERVIVSSVDDLLKGSLTLATKLRPAFNCPGTARMSAAPPASSQPVTLPEGLRFEPLRPGSGRAAQNGNTLVLHYEGRLTNGSVFDSSYKRSQPLVFELGAGQMIKGWELGLVGVQAGGKYRLTIPPELAYGSRFRPGIPANSTLVFDVEILEIR